jgi:hypothetical protein
MPERGSTKRSEGPKSRDEAGSAAPPGLSSPARINHMRNSGVRQRRDFGGLVASPGPQYPPTIMAVTELFSRQPAGAWPVRCCAILATLRRCGCRALTASGAASIIPARREACVRFLEDLRDGSDTIIRQSDDALWRRALGLYRTRPYKEWSFTDYMSFSALLPRPAHAATQVRQFFVTESRRNSLPATMGVSERMVIVSIPVTGSTVLLSRTTPPDDQAVGTGRASLRSTA